MALGFRILGPLEVKGTASLGGPKPRTLLARLLLEPNRVVSYDELIDALWPDDPPEQARHTLQVYVSSLRRALGNERIRGDRGGYALRVEPAELDAARFEDLVAEGTRLLRVGEAEAAHACLTKALALWRGDALADVAPALAHERARLNELRVAAGEEEIEAALALGQHGELVPRLESLVRRHPTRERLRRQLMLALYRSGRQADALGVYRDARRTLRDELGLEPSPDLRELEAAILRHDVGLGGGGSEAPARPEHHLPAPATPLVGRRREVDEISVLLTGGTRLVTLTGPGGAGKTRLAIQAASELAGSFADGVFFVSLGALRDPELVLPEIAEALSVEGARGLRAALTAHIRSRTQLLVLDSFEQVIDAAASIAGLLVDAPGLRLLVTSRHPLRVYGEHEYPVGPLSLDDEAVPLFLQRALASGRRIEADEAVRELCQRLDCLPLAIELAAARVREVSLEDLRAALPRLDAAVGRMRDVPARQRTLRAAIEWSYDLLEPAEQRAFEGLGVFVGGCTLAAARHVASAEPPTVRSLVDHSLLAAEDNRLVMLETIREYAVERLTRSGRAEAVRRRHAEHFLSTAEAGEEIRHTAAEVDWWNGLDADRDNVRAALAWWLEHDQAAAAGLAARVFRFWYTRAHYDEAALAYERVLAAADLPSAERARLLSYAAAVEFARRRFDRARPLAEESLELRRTLADPDAIARSLVMLGFVHVEEEAFGDALPLLEESVELARAVGDPVLLGFTVTNLAAALVSAGELERLPSVGAEALKLAQSVGDRSGERATLLNLGLAALLDGDPATAAARSAESLALARELGDPMALVESIEGVAAAAAEAGRAADAARLLGAAESAAAARSLVLESASRSAHERTLKTLRSALDPDDLQLHWRAGALLDADEAAAEAAALVLALLPRSAQG